MDTDEHAGGKATPKHLEPRTTVCYWYLNHTALLPLGSFDGGAPMVGTARRMFAVFSTLATICCILASQSADVSAQTPPQPADVVARYIKAMQQRDYKTVIDLAAAYQQDVVRIKAENPQVLWPKLVGEYYQDRIAKDFLPMGPLFYANTQWGALPIPHSSVTVLIRESCQWSITETRTEQVEEWQGDSRRQYHEATVYVSFDYPRWQDSPLSVNDGKFLRQTILEFIVDQERQLVLTIRQVHAGDAFWEDPLRIIDVGWSGFTAFGPTLAFTAAGGTAPRSGTIQLGSFKIDTSFNGSFGRVNPVQLNELKDAFPAKAVLRITDSQGRSDEVFFTVSDLPAGHRACWLREPWLSRRQLGPVTGEFECTEAIYPLTDSTTDAAPRQPLTNPTAGVADPLPSQPAIPPAAPSPGLDKALTDSATLSHSDFCLSYPKHWEEHRWGTSTVLAPRDGVRKRTILKGVWVFVLDLRTQQGLSFEQIRERAIEYRIESGMQEISRSDTQVGGLPGLLLLFRGPSAAGGQQQTQKLYVVRIGNKIFYAEFTAPDAEQAAYEPIFQQMLGSIQFR